MFSLFSGQADDASPPPAALPSLQDVVDRIGLGGFHIVIALVAGGVWVADGAELLLITSVTDAVGREWNLGTFERGSVVTFLFIGIMFGNLLSGSLGDWYGRRPPLLLSLVGIVVFSLLSACTVSYATLVGTRIFVGMSFGLGQPVYNALLSEIAPSRYRPLLMGLGGNLFPIGEIYSAILLKIDGDGDMSRIHWRWLLAMGSLPAAICFVLALIFVPESPMYQGMVDKMDKAEDTLRKLATWAGNSDMNVAFASPHVHRESTPKDAFWRQVNIIFGRQLLLTTLIASFTAFVGNVVYYGSTYAFPTVLPDLHMAGSTAIDLLLGAVIEFIGGVVAIVAVQTLPRKLVLKVGCALEATALIAFAFGSSAENGTHFTQTLLYFGYYAIKFGTAVLFMVTYQYATEVFPVDARTTGNGIVLSSGRFGGMVAPLVFEYVEKYLGFPIFFYGLGALCVINFMLIFALPFETFGMQLKDDIMDEFHSDAKLPVQQPQYGATASSLAKDPGDKL